MAQENRRSVDVFISYSHEDKAFAKELEANLRGESIGVWMDERISSGTPWRTAIDENLEAASLVVLIISPDSMKSAYVTYEWCYAAHKLNKPLHLVYLRKCEDDEPGMYRRLRSEFQIPGCLRGNPTQKDWEDMVAEIKVRLQIPRVIKSAGDRLIRDDEDWPSEIREKHEGIREERKRAAQELGQYDKEPYRQESCTHLLKGIENELATDRDGTVQVEIAKALRKVGDLRAIPALLKLRGREEEKKREDYEKRGDEEKRFYEPSYNAVCAALKDLVNRYS